MWVGIDRLEALVLDASLAATLLVGGIALAMVGCRQPSRRVGLARAAIVGSLAVFPLVTFSPLPRLDLFGTLQGAGLDAHPAWPDAESYRWLSGVAPSARLLMMLYLAGVGVRLAWLILGWWGLGWLIRRSSPPSHATLELYRALPFDGARRRPALRVATRVRGPVLIGIVRQAILIPPPLDRPESSGPLRLALLHELAHARESDIWFGVAGGLAGAFWFFLPPLWWVLGRMRLDHEFLADRRAASGFGTSGDYAASLLALSAPGPGGPSPTRSTPVAAGGPGSALFQRLLMLVRCPFAVEPHPPTWWRWSLPMCVAMATLAASSLSPRRAETSPPIPSALENSFRMARLEVPASPIGPRWPHPRVPPADPIARGFPADGRSLGRSHLIDSDASRRPHPGDDCGPVRRPLCSRNVARAPHPTRLGTHPSLDRRRDRERRSRVASHDPLALGGTHSRPPAPSQEPRPPLADLPTRLSPSAILTVLFEVDRRQIYFCQFGGNLMKWKKIVGMLQGKSEVFSLKLPEG